MYNDHILTTEFTGYYDPDYYAPGDGKYIYPTARQNFIIAFSDFYLSADDGDFTTDGITITSELCNGEDYDIGCAPAATLNATFLNPDGLMESLTWGTGTSYITLENSVTSISATLPAGTLCYVKSPYIEAIGSATGLKVNNATIPGLSDIRSLILSESNGTVLTAVTGTGAYKVSGGTATPTTMTPFMLAKYQNHSQSIQLNGFDIPYIRWDLDDMTKNEAEASIPMGTFDFSTVDAYGITFNAEVYDALTRLDADATDWFASYDFTGENPVDIISSIFGHVMGVYGVLEIGTLTNKTMTWATSPVSDYAITYRQLFKWLAELLGGNGAYYRGTYPCVRACDLYDEVATILPYVIVGNSRTVGRYAVPQVTELTVYDMLGAGHTAGSSGSTYHIMGNPFLDPSASMTPVNNLLTKLSGITAYYPMTITTACADPRIDLGDIITVKDMDGNSLKIPVMRQTLHWNGACRAEYQAYGSQVRQVPSSDSLAGYSAAVNSNPSAVISKVQAEGISADWITTGKLTVLDNNNDVLFEADKDAQKVDIAGFEVTDQSLDYVLTEQSPGMPDGYDRVTTVHFGTDGMSNSIDDWYLSDNNTPFITHDKLKINDIRIRIEDDNSNDPDTPYKTSATYMADNVTFAKHDGSNTLTDSSEFTASNIAISAQSPYGRFVGSGQGASITDGTNTATLKPDQLVFDDGDEAPILGVYKLFHNSSSTATATYTKTLPSGAYLLVHFRNGAPTTASTGLQIMVIGTSAYATVIPMDGSGANIGAASGSRSHVAVTSNGDGTGTVTWTVEGLSYRKLLMVRLT